MLTYPYLVEQLKLIFEEHSKSSNPEFVLDYDLDTFIKDNMIIEYSDEDDDNYFPTEEDDRFDGYNEGYEDGKNDIIKFIRQQTDTLLSEFKDSIDEILYKA